MTRCKFRCLSIALCLYADPPAARVTMEAVYSPEVPEDERFTKDTPSGTLDVTISNPAALAELKLGEYYYLDLSPASSPTAAPDAPAPSDAPAAPQD